MGEPILSARGVHVRFAMPGSTVHAVRGVDLDLHPGETVAIVGESGAGKSAFAKAILHLHQLPFTPNRTSIEGRITLHRPFEAELSNASPATIRKARARAVGMIFQDALSSLNPVQKIGVQISEALRQAGRPLDEKGTEAEILDIVEAIGLPSPRKTVNAYPHQLSGGQCQRVMIAIAAIRHPVAMIADEPTTALDVTVQAQILKLLKSLQDMRGMGMLFISHDLGVVAEIADRVAVMYDGKIVEIGRCDDIFTAPAHDYTRRLLASRPGSRPAASAFMPAGSQINGAGQPNGVAPSNGKDAAAAPRPVVVADNVSFAYRAGFFGGTRSEFVLQNASLHMQVGDVHGLVGESGSGKSTFGRLILGFLKPDSGHIQTNGVVPFDVAGAQRRAFRKAVQVVNQDSATALNPRLTLGRSAAEGLIIQGVPFAQARAEVRELFDRVHLSRELMDRFPHEVSGGQRQRVCIARALATNPTLLIADEPVTALDVSVQAQILELFGELQTELGLAMLFISHDLGVIRELCSRVSVMHKGRVVEEGPTRRVLEQPATPYAQSLIASIPKRAWARDGFSDVA